MSDQISDIDEIVDVHLKELSGNLLPSLGQRFLTALYKDFLLEKETILLVFRNRELKGFVLGVINFPDLFAKIIKHKFIKYSYLLSLSVIKNPLLIKNIIETLFYTKISGKTESGAELVVICVKKKYQNKGIGSLLLRRLETVLRDKKISTYKVSTTKDNLISNKFYLRNGFDYIDSFSLYNKEWNLYKRSLSG